MSNFIKQANQHIPQTFKKGNRQTGFLYVQCVETFSKYSVISATTNSSLVCDKRKMLNLFCIVFFLCILLVHVSFVYKRNYTSLALVTHTVNTIKVAPLSYLVKMPQGFFCICNSSVYPQMLYSGHKDGKKHYGHHKHACKHWDLTYKNTFVYRDKRNKDTDACKESDG